jgi:phosphoribosylglycinamide formyltransferase
MSAEQLPKILVLISGTGTNLQALIDATTNTPPQLSAKITHVIANLSQKAKPGLERASKAGIPTTVRTLKSYKDLVPQKYPSQTAAREAYDVDLADYILHQLPAEERPELVVCAGWMHILSPQFLGPLKEAGVPIINLHPALPGEFNGAHAIERAWQAAREGRIRRTGVMIHYVIEEVDEGQPIVVREVEIHDGESLEDLEERIHTVEHVAIVDGTRIALQKLREGKRN